MLYLALPLLALAIPPGSPISYRSQIAPILASSCNACHGGKTPQSGLVTSAYAALMKGGSRGRPIVPGNPDGSLLVQFIEGKKQPRMPIGGALKPQEIALIRGWIAAGAKSDGEAAARTTPGITVVKGVLPQAASLAWNRDGTLLAVGTYREVLLFAMPAGRLVRTLSGHADVVRSLAFSPDGASLAAAGGVPGESGEIRIWTVGSGAPLKTLQGHADAIYAVGWRPDGAQIASASYDKTVVLWDVAAGKEVTELKDHADAVFALAYSPNGKLLATASADRSIRIWSATDGKRLYSLAGHTDGVTAVAFAPNSSQLLSASSDKTVRLWNLRADSGDTARVYETQPDTLTDVVYSPNGAAFATACNDGTVKIWNTATGEVIKKMSSQPDAALAVAFSPKGDVLAVGDYDGSVRVYNTKDASLMASLISAPVRGATHATTH